MSVLYLDFPGAARDARVQKLARTGAHIVASDPRWPGFFELAKREKPYAIAIDFEQAPAHSLETADYLAKAKETRDAAIYLLRVPGDRLDLVAKRLPQAAIVTDHELAVRVVEAEKEAQERARQKKEAAAAARKNARARAGAAEKTPRRPPPPAPAKAAPTRPAARPKKLSARTAMKAAAPNKKPKKGASARKSSRSARKR
jgi:predicted Zn-dependent protease